jgi:chemotaxis protein MotB
MRPGARPAAQSAGSTGPALLPEGGDAPGEGRTLPTGAEAAITLGLLSAVEDNSAVTLRSVACQIGIALGLANAYLKRCVRKGWIKVNQAPSNRYAYYLTPQGFAEKSRLTAEYLSYSLQFFRRARGQCDALLAQCARRGWSRIVLAGASELAEIASLQRDLDALRKARDDMEAEVSRMVLLLEETRSSEAQATEELAASRERIEALLADLTAQRDRSMELEARVSDQEERTVLAQREIEERDIRITELAQAVTMTQEERDEAMRISDRRLAQVVLLNQQLAALRAQIAALNEMLDVSEAEAEANQVQIQELGARLNAALAGKVQELARYRSEFFEQLMRVLEGRSDIRVVGDRFVLPSELLFDSGSADISPAGMAELGKIARLMIDLTGEIPRDVDWILRVDGHTDIVPINTLQFPSNWELSTARATAVVRFLIGQGVPANRLAATGFGEFQPIESGDGPQELRRNRRIEFKLTEK